MSHNNCCTEDADNNVRVKVNVDVPKIVKYACITGVLIVSIVFGANIFHKMLEKDFFEIKK